MKPRIKDSLISAALLADTAEVLYVGAQVRTARVRLAAIDPPDIARRCQVSPLKAVDPTGSTISLASGRSLLVEYL
jgi:endonuclease YncB( thermonuclease family)